MIQWWGWLLIWAALVLGMLGMLAYFAKTLFRKIMLARDELTELTNALDAFDARLDEIAPNRKPSAIFQNQAALGHIVELNREAGAVKKQQRRDARVARGKLLIRSTENWTPPHA